MFLSKLILALRFVQAVFALPVDTTELEGPATHDLFRRYGGPDYYRPVNVPFVLKYTHSYLHRIQNLDRICRKRGYETASEVGQKCSRENMYSFVCESPHRTAIEEEACVSTHMCLETEGESEDIAAPNWIGFRRIMCMQVGERDVYSVKPGSEGGSTRKSRSAPSTPGHMYGNIMLYGHIEGTHPELQMNFVNGGRPGQVGSKTISDLENRGLYRTYGVEADYKGNPQFFGLVTDLSKKHGQITLSTNLAWSSKPISKADIVLL